MRSIQTHLKHVVATVKLTFEEFVTLLTGFLSGGLLKILFDM